MTSFQHTPIPLYDGQTVSAHMRRGTQVISTQGCVLLIEAPQWVSETMFSVHTRLAEGQAHCVSRNGRVDICALGDAEIMAVIARSKWQAALTSLKEVAMQCGQHLGMAVKPKPLP